MRNTSLLSPTRYSDLISTGSDPAPFHNPSTEPTSATGAHRFARSNNPQAGALRFILPQPTEDQHNHADFIRQGKIPAAEVVSTAVRNPDLLEKWVKQGLPLKDRYPDALKHVLENGASMRDFQKTMKIFRDAGVQVTWSHVDQAQHTLDRGQFVQFLKDSPATKGEQQANQLAVMLCNNRELRRYVAESNVLGDKRETFDKTSQAIDSLAARADQIRVFTPQGIAHSTAPLATVTPARAREPEGHSTASSSSSAAPAQPNIERGPA